MEERRTQLATGISMRFLELGPKLGEPVLMLHGYTDTSRSMRGTAEHLAALSPDLRLILPDQRGHGRSSLPAPAEFRDEPERAFGLAAFAEDAVALLDALNIPRAHIVGHSLGSFVAQRLVLDHPERVTSVVLIGSAARGVANTAIEQSVLDQTIERDWRPKLERQGYSYPGAVYELTPRDVDPDIERWLLANWVIEPLADPALMRAIARETARVPLGTWIGVARAVLGFDHRARLPELLRPTLNITAPDDPICPAEPDQRELHEALELAARRGVRIVERRYGTGLGHNFPWAVPDAVARDVAAFYEELRGRSAR